MSVTRSGSSTNQKILSPPSGVNDFGDSFYVCRFTGAIVQLDELRLAGAFINSVSGAYIAHKNSKPQEKYARQAFDESEANCNTCADFVRQTHEKDSGGMVKGKCAKGSVPKTNVYRQLVETYWVHPSDPMHVACWTGRR